MNRRQRKKKDAKGLMLIEGMVGYGRLKKIKIVKERQEKCSV